MINHLFRQANPLFTRRTQQMTVTALMIALGIIIPYVTGHAAGIPGTIALPMHLPVLLAGVLSGPVWGLLAGILTPILSSLLTGMPPTYPMLPIMLVQLAVMGGGIGLLTARVRLGLIPALILSSLAGWVAYGAVFQILLITNPNLRAPAVLAAIGTGVPGLILQLILVPALYLAVRHARGGKRRAHAPQQPEPSPHSLREAQAKIKEEGCSCVVLRDGVIIHEADGRGVKPLLQLYDHHPDKLLQSMVVDRIIGKGAAMILVLGGVRYVYGQTMSEAARAYLESHGIDARFETLIPLIHNRTQTGMCPIEDAVRSIEDPAQGLAAIRARVQELMAGTYPA